jgi:hypothetical protein
MAARKTVVKKAAQKAAGKKTAGKRAAAGKKAAAKKAAPRKASKAAARKAGPKKAGARKTTPKKASAKKTSPKKTSPKKASPKKAAPAKAPAKKAAPASSRKKTARKAGPAHAARPAPVRGAIPSTLGMGGGSSSSARTGREELLQHIRETNETSPAITAGDVDADWQTAYSSGDEAPGVDNPTPDQDIVDEIGEALGVNYEDGEELKGAAKIEARDKHRWELDPASKDDFEDS